MNLSRLRYYKQEKGYSMAKLSELSGVPLGTLQKIFSGETKSPRSSTLEALEAVLLPDEKEKTETEKDWPESVRESAPAYGTSGRKKQGEYTMEDYYALPDERRVELLDGVIYDMAAPNTIHQFIIPLLTTAFQIYIRKKKGGCLVFSSPVDVQIDCGDRTILQPDVMVLCERSKLIRRCIMGAPDLVIEIASPSSLRMDGKLKLGKYAQSGVREYWMIDPDTEKTVVYWTDETEVPSIYGPVDEVPVGIFGGELKISMREIFEEIRNLGIE